MRRTIDDVLAAAQARIPRVKPADALALTRDGWLIVDTRGADDLRARGRIPGAVHAALSVLEWRVDPASGQQDPALAGREDRLILICADGYSSSLAVLRLWELGYTNTTDVVGGFAAWAAEGLPIER